jgi:hypothetical protein
VSEEKEREQNVLEMVRAYVSLLQMALVGVTRNSTLVLPLMGFVARTRRGRKRLDLESGKTVHGDGLVTFAVPDEAIQNMRGNENETDCWLIVRVRRSFADAFQKPKSAIVMPGIVGPDGRSLH